MTLISNFHIHSKMTSEDIAIVKYIRKCMRNSKIDLIVMTFQKSDSSMSNVEKDFVSQIVKGESIPFGTNEFRVMQVRSHNELTKADLTVKCLEKDYPDYNIGKNDIMYILKSIDCDYELGKFVKRKNKHFVRGSDDDARSIGIRTIFRGMTSSSSSSTSSSSSSLQSKLIQASKEEKKLKNDKCQSCNGSISKNDSKGCVVTQCDHYYHMECLKSFIITSIQESFNESKKQVELINLDDDDDDYSIDLGNMSDDENDVIINEDDIYESHRNNVKCKYCMTNITKIKNTNTDKIIWDIEQKINLREWDPKEEDFIIQ